MIKPLSSLLLAVGVMLFVNFANAQDKSLKKFHWGVTSLSASQWLPWIAKDAKLYEKHGWKPSWCCCAARDNQRKRSSGIAFSAPHAP